MNALTLTLALLWRAQTVPDGSLLFLDNSNLFVELYTGSDTSHVAIVLGDGDRPVVYEATPGVVRKLPLDDYYAELARINAGRKEKNKIRARIASPREPYSKEQIAAMRAHLESQLGRRYSIKGYVRSESDGVHCAELAARTLCSAGALDIQRCQDESPQGLLKKVTPFSAPLESVAITAPVPQEPFRVKCRRDCESWSNWCEWSCWETWTWCW